MTISHLFPVFKFSLLTPPRLHTVMMTTSHTSHLASSRLTDRTASTPMLSALRISPRLKYLLLSIHCCILCLPAYSKDCTPAIFHSLLHHWCPAVYGLISKSCSPSHVQKGNDNISKETIKSSSSLPTSPNCYLSLCSISEQNFVWSLLRQSLKSHFHAPSHRGPFAVIILLYFYQHDIVNNTHLVDTLSPRASVTPCLSVLSHLSCIF